MENIQTMAVQITKETYSIAVACLPAGFAVLPFEKVDGAYLVINELGANYDRKKRVPTDLVVKNKWLDARHFDAHYTYDGRRDITTKFVPVRRVG